MDWGLSAQACVWTDSNASHNDCVKKRPWEDHTRGNETLVTAGGDQIGKSETEGGPGEQHLAEYLKRENRGARSMS